MRRSAVVSNECIDEHVGVKTFRAGMTFVSTHSDYLGSQQGESVLRSTLFTVNERREQEE
jgi:hypothetical protein